MKPTKKQNPFDVQIGQVWKPKDGRLPEFKITRFEKVLNGDVAVGVSMNGFHTMINLLRFDRYVKVK